MAKTTKKQESQEQSEEVKSSFIEPTMKFENHTNEFIKHVEEEQPELRAVGFARVPGTNNYAAYVLIVKGDKVIKMTVDEPNMRNVAEEAAKIQFVDIFVNSEEF